MTTKKQIMKNKSKMSEREYYETNKGLFSYFFAHNLPLFIMLDTLKNLSTKGEFIKLLNLAAIYEPKTYEKIIKRNQELEDFYNNKLDNIIEILSDDAKEIKKDKTPVNTLAYLINYHDLVGFSHTDFYRLVKRKDSGSEFAKILIDDYRATDRYHMTGKTVLNYTSFDEHGKLTYFDENSSRISQIFDRKITDEDYEYCIAKLEENGIPLLLKAVEGAVKAYANDSLDEFISCILERRYLTSKTLDLTTQAVSNSNVSATYPNEESSENSRQKVIVRRHCNYTFW